MDFFNRFTSNTIAGTANQHTFEMPQGEMRTGRAYYRIAHGGTFAYALLFSNVLDSTYADGSVSWRNLICPSWKIHSARLGCCRTAEPDENGLPVQLTFDGQAEKNVHPGEFFHSDPVEMTFEAGEYLCLEMTFSGTLLPYHEETLIPVFIRRDGAWQYDKHMPLPGMVGCDRPVRRRIAFVGDSLTQGIGVEVNSYQHWNAVAAEKLDADLACWNLGIGYARANDLATAGAWMYKALHNDMAVVCLGANDVCRSYTAQEIKAALTRVVDLLEKSGQTIVLQTIPPIDREGEQLAVWQEVNDWIRTELSRRAALLFDPAPLLQQDDEHPGAARYGLHPNAEGSAIWGEALYQALMDADILK